jgi:hypothetical protein
MSFKTGEVFLSNARMIADLEYIPLPRSKDKPETLTRGKIRNLVLHLERVGLIKQVKAGNLKAGLSATWHCLLATTDQKKALISSKREQPYNNQVEQPEEQPQEQPSESLVFKELEQQEQPGEQPGEQPESNQQEQPITGTTVIYIYKGLDLKPFEKDVSIEHLKHLIDHRITKKAKPTQHALKLQVKRLTRSQEVGMTPEELIDYTIEKNWIAVNIDYTKNDLNKIKGLSHAKPTKNDSYVNFKPSTGASELFNDPYENVNRLLQQGGG